MIKNNLRLNILLQVTSMVIFIFAATYFSWTHITLLPSKEVYLVTLLYIRDYEGGENKWLLSVAAECAEESTEPAQIPEFICTRVGSLFVAGSFVRFILYNYIFRH